MTTEERLPALDVLRGIALFCMILVHFHQRMRIETGGIEDLIAWVIWLFVEQKAWATFAFLFGAGFAILLRRLEARGQPVTSIYLRRLAMLAAFGIVADIGFGFHVLFTYACWGLALLVMRHWSTRALLCATVFSACATGVAWFVLGPVRVGRPAVVTALNAAAEQHSYLTLLSARWAAFIGTFPHSWRGVLPDVDLTLFILGLLAVRHGVFDQPKQHVRLIAGWMTFGVVAWVSWWWLPVYDGLGLLQDQWLCFTYIGGIVLLLAYRPAWTARLVLFAFAGRMALTNYMLQAAALDALSSGYGAHLKLRPYVYAPAAVVFFTIVAVASRAWLARFRFGPLEWVWRTVTYARVQPMVRAAAPPAVAVAST